jgi:DnaJ-class molecular chaperone
MIDKGTQPHNKGNWHKVNVQGEQIVLRKVPESYAKTPDACPFCAGTGEALPCMPCGNCGGTGRIRKIS